jgi:hypothetical protein
MTQQRTDYPLEYKKSTAEAGTDCRRKMAGGNREIDGAGDQA